jgi:hypothetical protein
MKYIDEYRDGKVAAILARRIAETVTRPWVLMEVRGGQTHSIVRYGIDRIIPPFDRAGARPRLPGVHPIIEKRKPLPSISLTADAAMLTAVGNDTDFLRVFVDQWIFSGGRAISRSGFRPPAPRRT